MFDIIPWMSNYPDIFNNIPIELLRDKYYDILKYRYMTSLCP